MTRVISPLNTRDGLERRISCAVPRIISSWAFVSSRPDGDPAVSEDFLDGEKRCLYTMGSFK